MPKFMSTHSLTPGGMTETQIREMARAAQQDASVRGYRSFVNLSDGKAMCIIEAPNKEALAAWFEKMGMPYDGIHPVELEGDRGEITRI